MNANGNITVSFSEINIDCRQSQSIWEEQFRTELSVKGDNICESSWSFLNSHQKSTLSMN